jgi:hypothetical protein
MATWQSLRATKNARVTSAEPAATRVHRAAMPDRRLAGGSRPSRVPVTAPVTGARDGDPMDAATTAFMAGRFGRDFSDVRVHTDAVAAESASRLDARAYTVGRDIVFGAGQYAPSTDYGRQTLAHELAHVVQQGHGRAQAPADGPGPRLVSDPSDDLEREADVASRRVMAGDLAVSAGLSQPDGGGHAAPAAIQRLTPVPTPDFAQRGDTCQPASMISALIVWDRERADPANPNANLVGVCEAALLYMDMHKPKLVGDWSAGGADGLKTFTDAWAMVTRARDDLRKPGSAPTESQYQDLGGLLSRFGDSTEAILVKLGLKAPTSAAANNLADIFSSPALTGLTPGQTAQIEWYVNTTAVNASTGAVTPSTGYHAFLIGLSKDNTWFLSDQANKPQPLKLEAASLPDLKKALEQAAATGKSWIVTNPAASRLLLTWTGVHVLAQQDYDAPFRRLVPPGTFLAEVDAGPLYTGDRINAWDFLARYNSLNEAYSNFLVGFGSGHGGLVIEEPAGFFTLFKTSPVSDDNANETSIDASDSKDGLLGGTHTFTHAWLMLGTKMGRKMRPFGVY